MNCVGIDVSRENSIIDLDGETCVVMESTGNYHTPVAWLQHYISVVKYNAAKACSFQ